MFGVKSNERLLKYEQIVVDVQEAIRQRILRQGDELPSITRVSAEYGVARETAVKAYRILKEQGVVEARAGKGFHVASEALDFRPRIFLMLNNLNPYMEVLYNAFLECVGIEAVVDVFFHHANIRLFEDLVTNNLGKYYSYVIKPFNDTGVESVLAKIDPRDLLILDRRDFIGPGNSYICQDFDRDFSASLSAGLKRLQRYDRIVLVFPPATAHPSGAVETFERFCTEHGLAHAVAKEVAEAVPRCAYITVMDDDLVGLLRSCRRQSLTVGDDVGIVAYNDYPMKEFVAGGITAISADFAALGREAAAFALSKQPVKKLYHATLIERLSL